MLYEPRKSRKKFCENLGDCVTYKDSFTAMIFFVFCSWIMDEFMNDRGGAVVHKQVSLTLGWLEIRSKFSKSLFVNLKNICYKSCLDRSKFSFLNF